MKLALKAGRERRQCIGRVMEKLRFLPLHKDYEIYIRPWRPPENNQRDYYWVGLRYLSDQKADDIEIGGWEAEDFHEWFKQELGVKSTKDFSVDEWTDHINKTWKMAAEVFGIAIPDPS